MSGLYLFVGGIFNGQTRQLGLGAGGLARITIPIISPNYRAYFTDSEVRPQGLTMETADYEVAPPGAAERYFPAWRDVEGRPLVGLLLGPLVQKMGLQRELRDSEPPRPPADEPLAREQWERQHERWEQMRLMQELSALDVLRDSHMVNRQVSPVRREKVPSEMPWGGTLIRYTWLAEVERQTAGVTSESTMSLSESPTMLDRLWRLAAAEFPESVPADLQAVLDRASAREAGRVDG